MPVMGTLTAGDSVVVRFVAGGSNGGVTFVNTGYVARPGVAPAPVLPPTLQVGPGDTGTQQTTVGAAFSLVIDVDVPATGGGQLTVQVNGTERDSDTIAGDVDWSYVVV